MAVRFYPGALDELLYGVAGPVQRHVYRTAEAIRDIAKELIHTSPEAHADGSPHLKDTSEIRPLPGRGYAVAFTAPYAAAVHNGSVPHVIVARNAQALSFVWPKAGGARVFFYSVNHPGTKPFPYLRHAAEIVRTAPLA